MIKFVSIIYDFVRKSFLFCILLLWNSSCLVEGSSANRDDYPDYQFFENKIKGLTLVAPRKPFIENPMPPVIDISADWIGVVPYGYTPNGEPVVMYDVRRWQWWGERPEGIRETIKLAKEKDLKIMLKPQVWGHGWWTGDYDFSTEADWRKWEKDLTEYTLFYARMAQEFKVDLFCFATEFKHSIANRPEFWTQLIDQVKNEYQGPVTYAANWDNFKEIPFWNKLDVVGINAYFPLIDQKTPETGALQQAWKPHKKDIQLFFNKVQKPILFTEYGYLSVDRCAYNTWELDKKLGQIDINQQAQANALEALYSSFWSESYWIGGFLWKWFPNMEGHEGYPERDYTPQGKLAEKTIKTWFVKE